MPGKVIIDHYKKMKSLEEKLEGEIDQIIDLVSVERLMEDPEAELMAAVEEVRILLEDEYFEKAARLGIEFGQKIETKIDRGHEIKVEVGTVAEKTAEFNDKVLD